MFARRPIFRGIAVSAFIANTLATAVLSGVLWPYMLAGLTGSARKSAVVWLYVPSLLFHSFLFALKVYRFLTSPKYLQRDTLLWRFLKEGMVMYACALGSLLFIVIGVTMTDPPQIPACNRFLKLWRTLTNHSRPKKVYETAFTGGVIFVALTVVSVCRAMLSIKSLAATVHVDPGWLLNHAELSRVHWRRGETEGEIMVEMLSDSYDLPVMSGMPSDAESALTIGAKGKSGSSGTTVSPQYDSL
ncbi:hypothetical protein J3R83DRAFT_10428 [Lanmaoa asiatica]|nr:hypothetical protein J3R83DRAFT_10428 [Lanmaoa asiatica]